MNLFREFFETQPAIAWLAAILLAGQSCLAIVLVLVCVGAMVGAWRSEYRRQRRSFYNDIFNLPATSNQQPSTGRAAPTEVNMKSRIALVAILAIAFTAISFLSGCSTLGNGKIDPGGVVLLDLTAIDVSVQWVSEDGREFSLINENGQFDLEAEFIEPKTGLVFTMGEGPGNVTIRDPMTGLQVQVKPKNEALAKALAPPDPTAADQLSEILDTMEEDAPNNPAVPVFPPQ